MTRDTAERAREWREKYCASRKIKLGQEVALALDESVTALLTQFQAEARLEGLKEAFLLRPRLVKEWDSAQFREGYYSGLEAFRQAIQAVLAQALQPEEKEK